MSFFGKIFGDGKNKTSVPTSAEAIQKLRQTEEMMYKKQEFLEKKIDDEMAIAKKNASKNKRAAIQALKKKKRYEAQLKQIDGTLTTIEFQREALENANTNTEVLKIMGEAATALKSAHQKMNIDDVHELMDDIQEAQEVSLEIANALAGSFANDYDEDELERELEDLEQEELDEHLLDVSRPSVDELPSPPSAVPKKAASKAKNEEDENMSELLQWAT